MKKWLGYLRISINGLDIERQVRKILSLGIVLGNLKRDSATRCSFDVFAHEVPKLRKAGIRFKTDVKGGLTVLAYSARKRFGLIAGVMLVAAFLILLQGRVLFIEVSGNSEISTQEILSLMDEDILYSVVDGEQMEAMEQRMLNDKRLQWVSITKKGVRMTVTVKEKPIMPSSDYKTAGDIVASKVGVISEVTVLQGEAEVASGELVLPGDVLIRGELIYADAQSERIAAMGKCMAKVWYSAEKEISLIREKRMDTDEVFISRSIMIFGKEFGGEAPEFENYRVIQRVSPIAKMGIPIYRVERKYIKQEISWYTITPEQGLEEYKQELEQEMEGMVQDAELSYYCMQTENGAIVGVSAVKLEDIGEFKPYEEK